MHQLCNRSTWAPLSCVSFPILCFWTSNLSVFVSTSSESAFSKHHNSCTKMANPIHSGGTQSTTNTLLSSVTTTKVTSTFPNGSVTIKVKTTLATTQTGAIRPSSTSTSALGTSSTSGSVNSSSTTSSSPAGSQSKRPASTSTSKGSSDTGAIVGAAVGCLIGGALLAFLAAWFFFKRRNKRDQLNRQSSSYRGRDHRSPARKPVPTVAAAGIHEKSSSTSGDSGSSWQAYLPQSVDDQTIRRDIKTLFDQIDLHVDNYYTKANVRIDSGTSRALSEYNDENLPDTIEALMANPQTSLPTIKHCIARMLVTRMSPGNDRASLLPEYLAAPQTKLNSSMSPGERIGMFKELVISRITFEARRGVLTFHHLSCPTSV